MQHKEARLLRADVRAARAAYVAANTDRARVYQERRAVKLAVMQLRTKPNAIRQRQPWTPAENTMALDADRRDKLEAAAIANGRSYESGVSRGPSR